MATRWRTLRAANCAAAHAVVAWPGEQREPRVTVEDGRCGVSIVLWGVTVSMLVCADVCSADARASRKAVCRPDGRLPPLMLMRMRAC